MFTSKTCAKLCNLPPSGELDIYKANSEALVIMSGAEVGAPQPATYNGIPVEEWPRVVLSPAFAPCLDAIKVGSAAAVDFLKAIHTAGGGGVAAASGW